MTCTVCILQAKHAVDQTQHRMSLHEAAMGVIRNLAFGAGPNAEVPHAPLGLASALPL